ncbi:MAG TPA: MopE-related protein, partial [Polyangia bacterium]|nr:MopE-related protein [Polyangia bacterium]
MVPSTQKLGLGLAVGVALALAAPAAEAHKNGIASQGCSGCHNGGAAPTVTITSSATPISPGQTVMLSVNITTPEGWAGLFLQADVGTLASLAGQGTQILSGGITHTTPKQAVNGVATFVVGWTAPATPGGVNLNVYALAANGDGTSRGDGAGTGFESFAFGCGAGTLYYRDFDGDGWGAMSSGYTRNCSLPKYYATMDGDCNDSDERIYPGAMEVCNKRDDNCNGMIDEGLPILTCHVDMDGDGHGSPSGPTVTGDCACAKGTAPGTDDCNDNDPTVYGGATEVCDYKDNNCNGQIDEGARVRCGTGWCARLGNSCDSTSCTPGAPRAEVCNDFDDDCDGVIDNGTSEQLCGAAGMLCVVGTCYPADKVPPDAGAPSTGSGGGAVGVTGAGAGPGTGGVTGAGVGVAADPGAGGTDGLRR